MIHRWIFIARRSLETHMETNVVDFLVLFRNAEHLSRSFIGPDEPEIRNMDAGACDDRVQYFRSHGKSTVVDCFEDKLTNRSSSGH